VKNPALLIVPTVSLLVVQLKTIPDIS
jgi:hypothetical protein